jgi:hypothetical protein
MGEQATLRNPDRAAAGTEFATVARKLDLVRGAWRRTRVVAGAVVVLLESAGIFAVAVLVDWLYNLGPVARVFLLLAVAVAVAYLVRRHVLAPLLRRITHEQLALYVEEHNPEFEGALMSAAEFGPRGGSSAVEQELVRAIVREAVRRAEGHDLRSVVDIRRLKKYGAAAVLLGVFYLGMGLLFPDSFGYHATRIMFMGPPEADAASGPAEEKLLREREKLLPLEITLSATDSRILRGTPFDVEATLSRRSPDRVLMHFRPAAVAGPVGDLGRGSGWRELPMEEIEKINTFHLMLPDVNEDMLFAVSTGEARTPVHRITVYDPLVIEGLEVTTRFPAYLEMPDRVERQPTGDVAAPEGSKVSVRVLANADLVSGQIDWTDGETQDMSAFGGTALATFDVTEDRYYTFQVRDVNGQEAGSAVPAFVHAIKDTPPKLVLKTPKYDLDTHPLSEIRYVAEADDDYGVASVELVYRRVSLEGEPTVSRVTLDLRPVAASGPGPQGPNAVEARGRLLIEDFDPRPETGDFITWHMEARDRKGHAVMTDIFFVAITPFEAWASHGTVLKVGAGSVRTVSGPVGLAKFVAAAWHLHTQKDYMPEDEFRNACQKLAKKFEMPTGGLYNFWPKEK